MSNNGSNHILDMKNAILSDYHKAINNNDLEIITKLRFFMENLHYNEDCGDYKELQSLIVNDDINYIPTYKQVDNIIRNWLVCLEASSLIDIYSVNEKKWFLSKVLENNIANDYKITVHYQGWDSKYDETFDISTKYIALPYTFSKSKKVPKVVSTNEFVVVEVDDIIKTTTTTTISNTNIIESNPSNINVTNEYLPIEKENIIVSRSGRRIKETILTTTSSSNKKSKKNLLPNSCEGTPSRTNHTLDSTVETAKDTTSTAVKDPKDLNDWICAICSYLEAVDGSDLVLCEGNCRRSFHLGCLNMKPLPSKQIWYCDDCCDQQHCCFICGGKGVDHQDVYKCNVYTCGKYYHIDCLRKSADVIIIPPNITNVKKEVLFVRPSGTKVQDNIPTSISKKNISGSIVSSNIMSGTGSGQRTIKRVDYSTLNKGQSKKQTAIDIKWKQYKCNEYSIYHTTKELMDTISFKCPLHCCYNCFEFYKYTDSNDLNKCILCPRSYHTNCIAPGSRFNSLCLLCPRHPDAYLPAHDMIKVDTKTKKLKILSNEFSIFYDQLIIPDLYPEKDNIYDNHFRLQTHLQEDVLNMPHNFKMIAKNDYELMHNKAISSGFQAEVCCECTDDCGEDCLNRILRIECCDLKGLQRMNTGGHSSLNGGDQNICSVGTGCSNRQMQHKKYAKTAMFQEFQRGWGLKACDNIASGSLIMEYVGEVIDHAEVQRRMNNQRLHTPQDRDFYIMELDNGLYVDGKFKGSNSRFINHSCDPNCELQRWVVKGQPRIGIFAIKDIKNNEALSYDYQFDTKEEESFKCFCQTSKCRGSMAPKKKKIVLYDSNGIPQSREERLKLIMIGKSKEKSLSVESAILEEWARSYTGKMQPSDGINEIRNGPVKSLLLAGSLSKIFLVRNIKQGNNFLKRSNKYKAKI